MQVEQNTDTLSQALFPAPNYDFLDARVNTQTFGPAFPEFSGMLAPDFNCCDSGSPLASIGSHSTPLLGSIAGLSLEQGLGQNTWQPPLPQPTHLHMPNWQQQQQQTLCLNTDSRYNPLIHELDLNITQAPPQAQHVQATCTSAPNGIPELTSGAEQQQLAPVPFLNQKCADDAPDAHQVDMSTLSEAPQPVADSTATATLQDHPAAAACSSGHTSGAAQGQSLSVEPARSNNSGVHTMGSMQSLGKRPRHHNNDTASSSHKHRSRYFAVQAPAELEEPAELAEVC